MQEAESYLLNTAINMKKLLITLCLSLLVVVTSKAQPTFHDSYRDLFVSAGYQFFSQKDIGVYHTASLSTEVLYSFVGTKANFMAGPGCLQFSPAGLLLFVPSLFFNTYNSLEGTAATMLVILGVSALQFHIPLTDHLEISTGWDALRFTKFNALDSRFFISGSLNLGLNFYIGNHFFINGAYEFCHPHNPLLKAINWLFRPPGGANIPLQPDWLLGHSVIVKVGYMF